MQEMGWAQQAGQRASDVARPRGRGCRRQLSAHSRARSFGTDLGSRGGVRGHGVSARCGASTCDSCTCKRYVRALYNVRAACHRTLGLATNVRTLSLSVSRASNGISLPIFFRAPSTGSPRSYATSIDSTLKHVEVSRRAWEEERTKTRRRRREGYVTAEERARQHGRTALHKPGAKLFRLP